MRTPEKTDRNQRVVAMRALGLTWKQIAQEIGVSESRAKMIWEANSGKAIEPEHLEDFRRCVNATIYTRRKIKTQCETAVCEDGDIAVRINGKEAKFTQEQIRSGSISNEVHALITMAYPLELV